MGLPAKVAVMIIQCDQWGHFFERCMFIAVTGIPPSQVAALGCKSFALLFDDIDSEMLLADAKEFPSFAHAQVTITNDIYAQLGRPNIFLFCPTGMRGRGFTLGFVTSNAQCSVNSVLKFDPVVVTDGPCVLLAQIDHNRLNGRNVS